MTLIGDFQKDIWISFKKGNSINNLQKVRIKNCFSVDVESFVESNLQSFHIEEKYLSKSKGNYEIENNVNSILSLLDNLSIKGTFFFFRQNCSRYS